LQQGQGLPSSSKCIEIPFNDTLVYDEIHYGKGRSDILQGSAASMKQQNCIIFSHMLEVLLYRGNTLRNDSLREATGRIRLKYTMRAYGTI
jgi:hypothetical protein